MASVNSDVYIHFIIANPRESYLFATHFIPKMFAQDEDIVRRRLKRSNKTLLSPSTVSSWWSQKTIARSSELPSQNNTVTSDQLPVTSDQISVTAAITCGRLDLPLDTAHGGLHGQRSPSMVSPELVDSGECPPVLAYDRGAKFALWERLASGFHDDLVMSALPRPTIRALKSLLKLASAGCGGPDVPPATVPHFGQLFIPVDHGNQNADSDATACIDCLEADVAHDQLCHDTLQCVLDAKYVVPTNQSCTAAVSCTASAAPDDRGGIVNGSSAAVQYN